MLIAAKEDRRSTRMALQSLGKIEVRMGQVWADRHAQRERKVSGLLSECERSLSDAKDLRCESVLLGIEVPN